MLRHALLLSSLALSSAFAPTAVHRPSAEPTTTTQQSHTTRPEGPKHTHCVGRRAALQLGALTILADPLSARGEDSGALPSELRKYTALAPLGSADAQVGGVKRRGLALQELAAVLARDVEKGAHGKGGYFISGDLSPEVFRDDCRFVDPTNDVTSLSRYKKALEILFDPAESKVELLSPPVVDESARTITARLRSDGVLKLPWRPYIRPYETNIVWSVGDDGLVFAQNQKWSITAFDALLQSFTPGRKKQ